MQVSEYSYLHFQTGLTFIYAIDDPRRPLSPEHIFVYIGNSGNIDPGDMPIQARISLPTSLGRRIRRNNSRVSFVIYRTTALFLSPSLIEFNANQTEFSRKANTRVISASIDSMPISNLSEPVVTSYHPIFTNANEVCMTLNLSGFMTSQVRLTIVDNFDVDNYLNNRLLKNRLRDRVFDNPFNAS